MTIHCHIAALTDVSPARRDAGLRMPGKEFAFDGKRLTID